MTSFCCQLATSLDCRWVFHMLQCTFQNKKFTINVRAVKTFFVLQTFQTLYDQNGNAFSLKHKNMQIPSSFLLAWWRVNFPFCAWWKAAAVNGQDPRQNTEDSRQDLELQDSLGPPSWHRCSSLIFALRCLYSDPVLSVGGAGNTLVRLAASETTCCRRRILSIESLHPRACIQASAMTTIQQGIFLSMEVNAEYLCHSCRKLMKRNTVFFKGE